MSRVSVIIPTYNCAQYIGVAVESVLAQTFADYELIVVDDGSTDETGDVLKQYEGRLTLIRQENQERSAARNTGIRASAGQYIAFLDSDDIWQPDKLERQVAILDQHPEVVLTYCQASYVDTEGRPIRFVGESASGESGTEVVVSDLSRDLLLGNVISGGCSTPIVRREALDEVGFFDETLCYPEDWDLWVRLSKKGPFAYVPRPLARYRVYGWHKVLTIEASERLVAQHLEVIERGLAGSHSVTDEQARLRAQAVATVYMRAALANLQLGRPLPGRAFLEKALAADPGLTERQRLVQLVVDRAKLIETDTGDYGEAEDFVYTFFANLPDSVARFKSAGREALGWLNLAAAHEKQQCGDKVAARRLLTRGITYAPTCLKNLGVISMALEAWLGRPTTNVLRQTARRVLQLVGRSANT